MNKFLFHFISLFTINLLPGQVMQLRAQNHCDPSLPQIPDNPLSYHDRSDRCEGIYIQPLGSTTLQVVSLTRSFESYDLSSTKPIQVEWNKFPGNNAIHLRARGTKRRLYYRMDTYCSADKTRLVGL